jgi:hypothetical protein
MTASGTPSTYRSVYHWPLLGAKQTSVNRRRVVLTIKRHVRLESARPQDAEAMLTVHHAAVHGTAAHFYEPEIIEDWGSPICPENVEGLAQRILIGEEEAVVARDASGDVIGFGSIVNDPALGG